MPLTSELISIVVSLLAFWNSSTHITWIVTFYLVSFVGSLISQRAHHLWSRSRIKIFLPPSPSPPPLLAVSSSTSYLFFIFFKLQFKPFPSVVCDIIKHNVVKFWESQQWGPKGLLLISIGLLWRRKSPALFAKARIGAESRYSGSSSKWLLFLLFFFSFKPNLHWIWDLESVIWFKH